jgi:hypothetical protein
MRYSKKKLYKEALEIAEQKKCFFIEQLVSFMPCAKQTFYHYFPIGSNEMDAIKETLELNRVNVKTSMYNKWFKSDHPTLQVALMKLIGTDEEAHRLNGSRTVSDVVVHDDELPKEMKDLPDEIVEQIAEHYQKIADES